MIEGVVIIMGELSCWAFKWVGIVRYRIVRILRFSVSCNMILLGYLW